MVYTFFVRYTQKKKSNGVKSGLLGGHSTFPRSMITRPENALESHPFVIIEKWGIPLSCMKCTLSAFYCTENEMKQNKITAFFSFMLLMVWNTVHFSGGIGHLTC